jgi:hypothetical protein
MFNRGAYTTRRAGGDTSLDALTIPKARVTRTGEQGVLNGQSIQLSWVVDDVAAPQDQCVAIVNLDGSLLCIAG